MHARCCLLQADKGDKAHNFQFLDKGIIQLFFRFSFECTVLDNDLLQKSKLTQKTSGQESITARVVTLSCSFGKNKSK